MKKTVSVFLAFVLVFCMLLTACDDQTDNPQQGTNPPTQSSQGGGESGGGGSSGGGGGGSSNPSNPSTPSIPSTPPTGYLFYTLGDLRFAYPDTWEIITEGEDTEISDEATGNNIELTSGSAAQVFQNMTAAEYQNTVSSMLESQYDWDVSDETAEKKQNDLGLTINVITVTITIDTVSLKQVTYAATVNDVPYAIVLTLAEQNDALEEKLFDSMVNINPTTPTPDGGNPQDPQAPVGYTTFTNYNLRFAYPSDWTTTDTAPTRSATFTNGMSSLTLQTGTQTTMFEEMTLDSFQRDYVADLEAGMGGTLSNASVTHQRNNNNLNVTRVSYSVTTSGMTLYQYWFCVTVDQTTHWLMLTLASEDTTMVSTILHSIEATNGDNYGS